MPLFFSKYIKFFASVCAVLVFTSSLSTQAFAQEVVPDFEAPLIEHYPLEFSASDPEQLFTATVADNIGLLAVRLFYRYKGEEGYRTQDMSPVADSSLYTARISIKNGASSTIEYYLQAEDQAGNVVLKGYAFAPLERVLSLPTEISATSGPAADPEPTNIAKKPRSKVLYYVLGVLAVGALAAAAGGGGDGERGGEPCVAEECLVTFTLTEP